MIKVCWTMILSNYDDNTNNKNNNKSLYNTNFSARYKYPTIFNNNNDNNINNNIFKIIQINKCILFFCTCDTHHRYASKS